MSQYGHFPLADRSVTLCVGLSVFTHIDGYETAWLADIHRVLKPGGCAFLTIHSEHSWPLVPQRSGLFATIQQDPVMGPTFDPNTPMPEERVVFNFKPGTIYHCCNTFLHTNYVSRVWSKWFEIVSIDPAAHHNFQTIVVLRKR